MLNGKEWRLVMLLKYRSKLWRIQSFLFQRMLQSVFLMMEGGDGGITISGLRLMISVRLPLFDSEPGTRRNRTWDETQPNLGRRSLASLVDGLSGRRQCCCDGWKCVWFPVAS